MKKTKRNYSGSDSYMLETSSALQLLFIENLSDFTAMDSTLDAAFATAWLAKINAGISATRHSQIKDILGHKTEQVQSIMEQSREKNIEVKFFVEKAFPESAHIQHQFGLDDYEQARRSQARMILYLEELHAVCTIYSVELLAQGMSQPQIDAIETLRNDLHAANADQDRYARKVPTLTKERLAALNDCYASTRLVVNAAMVIYYTNYEFRRMFVYSPSSGTTNDTEIVEMLVMEGMPVQLYSITYESTRQFVLDNRGPAMVTFYLADDPSGLTNQRDVFPGERATVSADELGVDGANLYATIQPGSAPNADVEVEISL